jgi:hypothetical protein
MVPPGFRFAVHHDSQISRSVILDGETTRFTRVLSSALFLCANWRCADWNFSFVLTMISYRHVRVVLSVKRKYQTALGTGNGMRIE